MGFLNMRRALLIAIVVAEFSACNYIRFKYPLTTAADDWNMYGGSPARTNVAKSILLPPLAPKWVYDASAGFSPYSAAVVDSYLFIGNLQGEIHVVNINTGKGAGNTDFGSAIIGTPVIDHNVMYIALSQDEESVIAYDLFMGKVSWKASVGAVESSPLLIENRLYVTTYSGKLVCMSKQTGETSWTFTIPQRTRTKVTHSSPASDGETIIFGCDNGDLYAVTRDDGKLLWSVHVSESIIASPSVSEGKVFAGSLNDTLYAFDMKNGKGLWKQSLGAKIFSSQAVDGNRVYVGTAGRNVYCLDASTGKPLWKTTTNNIVNAAPLLSGNVLYVGCIDKTLYAYDALSGELLWQYKTEGRIKTMPVVSKQYLFVLVEDHSVIAFTHVDQR
jgi:outer membrane protein assembly factor BamB